LLFFNRKSYFDQEFSAMVKGKKKDEA